MKPPLKALLLAVVVLIAVPVVAWTATFLYWHFRIRAAITPLEEGRNVGVASDTLKAGGCRVFPYLVSALSTSKNPGYLLPILRYQMGVFTPDSEAQEFPAWDSSIQLLYKCDSDPAGIARVQEWWAKDGHHFHQWWRVWSSDCMGTGAGR